MSDADKKLVQSLLKAAKSIEKYKPLTDNGFYDSQTQAFPFIKNGNIKTDSSTGYLISRVSSEVKNQKVYELYAITLISVPAGDNNAVPHIEANLDRIAFNGFNIIFDKCDGLNTSYLFNTSSSSYLHKTEISLYIDYPVNSKISNKTDIILDDISEEELDNMDNSEIQKMLDKVLGK